MMFEVYSKSGELLASIPEWEQVAPWIIDHREAVNVVETQIPAHK